MTTTNTTNKIIQMCIRDSCYTYPATISRFCKDMNCKSFVNFKNEIAIALEIARNEIHLSTQDAQKVSEDSDYLKKKMYHEAMESLALVEKSIDMKDIDRICAVSYTHLDVYKRQVILYLHKGAYIIVLAVIILKAGI